MYPLRNETNPQKLHLAEQLKSHQRNERIHYLPRKMERLPGSAYPKSAGSVAPVAYSFMCSESRTSILCRKRWNVNGCHRLLWPLSIAEKRRGRGRFPGSAYIFLCFYGKWICDYFSTFISSVSFWHSFSSASLQSINPERARNSISLYAG